MYFCDECDYLKSRNKYTRRKRKIYYKFPGNLTADIEEFTKKNLKSWIKENNDIFELHININNTIHK